MRLASPEPFIVPESAEVRPNPFNRLNRQHSIPYNLSIFIDAQSKYRLLWMRYSLYVLRYAQWMCIGKELSHSYHDYIHIPNIQVSISYQFGYHSLLCASHRPQSTSFFSGTAYVAAGLSVDDKMGSDSVIECVRENDQVNMYTSYTRNDHTGSDRHSVSIQFIASYKSHPSMTHKNNIRSFP